MKLSKMKHTLVDTLQSSGGLLLGVSLTRYEVFPFFSSFVARYGNSSSAMSHGNGSGVPAAWQALSKQVRLYHCIKMIIGACIACKHEERADNLSSTYIHVAI